MIRQLPNRKLTPEKVAICRWLRKNGTSVAELALLAGVSEPTMSLALTGRTYKEIPNPCPGRKRSILTPRKRGFA